MTKLTLWKSGDSLERRYQRVLISLILIPCIVLSFTYCLEGNETNVYFPLFVFEIQIEVLAVFVKYFLIILSN